MDPYGYSQGARNTKGYKIYSIPMAQVSRKLQERKYCDIHHSSLCPWRRFSGNISRWMLLIFFAVGHNVLFGSASNWGLHGIADSHIARAVARGPEPCLWTLGGPSTSSDFLISKQRVNNTRAMIFAWRPKIGGKMPVAALQYAIQMARCSSHDLHKQFWLKNVPYVTYVLPPLTPGCDWKPSFAAGVAQLCWGRGHSENQTPHVSTPA